MAAAAGLLLALPSAALAQDAPALAAAGSVGPGFFDGDFGVGGAAALELAAGRLTVGARPAEVAVVPGAAEPGYRRVRLGNGQRRCREVATGRFAADSRCVELRASLAAALEAGWWLTAGRRPLALGAGWRVGDAGGPYGYLRWRAVRLPGSSWHLRAAAGPSVVRLDWGLRLPF